MDEAKRIRIIRDAEFAICNYPDLQIYPDKESHSGLELTYRYDLSPSSFQEYILHCPILKSSEGYDKPIDGAHRSLLNWLEQLKFLTQTIIEHENSVKMQHLGRCTIIKGKYGELLVKESEEAVITEGVIAEQTPINKFNRHGSKSSCNISQPLRGYSDVVNILLPAIGKGCPLPEDVIGFLLEISEKYPHIDTKEQVNGQERKRKHLAKMPEIAQKELSKGWIDSRDVVQLCKVFKETLESLTGDLHETSVFLLSSLVAFLLEKDGRVRGDARIAELEADLAAAQQQITDITNAQPTPGVEAEAAELTPQQKASLARQENTLNAWKPVIDAMVKVAVRCGEEGRKLRQQPDFNLMFNELDAVLNEEQRIFFRQSLPDEHIDRTGGKRGKN